MIRLYYGFDPKEEVGSHTFLSSVIHKASEPVEFIPLHLPTIREYHGGQRDGTNAFIYSRFLIPYLNGWKGWAIFADGADMICKGDIAELWAMRNPYTAVQVVKHDYKTKHPRKYIGTTMEADNRDYPRKNWSSLMIINCSSFFWRDITPETVAKFSGSDLHQFSFIPNDRIGDLPAEWNWLADEYGENENARLLHWTAGIPAWGAYKHAPHADDWRAAYKNVNHAA